MGLGNRRKKCLIKGELPMDLIDEIEAKNILNPEELEQYYKVKQKILDTALQMRCPVCNSHLIQGVGQKKYETLCDHVSSHEEEDDYPNRDYFVCPNDICQLHVNSFWDCDGAFYTRLDTEKISKVFGKTIQEYWHDRICTSAMNSLDRKIWYEVYYKEETKIIFISRLGIQIKNKIKADEEGNILERKPYIQLFLKEKDGSGCIYYTPGIIMILHHMKHLKYLHKKCIEVNSTDPKQYPLKEMLNQFELLPKWENRWWRKVEKMYTEIRYHKYRKAFL
jgi:hypothetical protein